MRRLEERTHRDRAMSADYIEIQPPLSTDAELADLAGRLNWYFPKAARGVPIYAPGSEHLRLNDADAWYLDPSLLHDPGWTNGAAPPPGRRHIAIRKLTPRTSLTYLTHLRNATLIAHDAGYGVEDGFFRLHRRFGTTAIPSPSASIDRLLTKAAPEGTALVLATGPSAQLVDPATVDADVRIVCNSAVRDRQLIAALKPDVIAFGDPVFHYGPSKYAAAFRDDLYRALEESDAVVLTSQLFVEPLVASVPQISERLVVLPLVDRGDWVWPTKERAEARITPNVLTNLMLPAAFALANNVEIAGCDGRNPSERYFWKHNTATQYSDDMMRTAFEAHQAFFRDRDYADYYSRHCEQLEEFLSTGERAGKQISAITPSHIPALLKRGAPRFESGPPS